MRQPLAWHERRNIWHVSDSPSRHAPQTPLHKRDNPYRLDLIFQALADRQLLEASGLIQTEKIGRVRTCSLNRDALQMAGAWLARNSR